MMLIYIFGPLLGGLLAVPVHKGLTYAKDKIEDEVVVRVKADIVDNKKYDIELADNSQIDLANFD